MTIATGPATLANKTRPVYGGGNWLVCGTNGTATYALTSTDGVTWASNTLAAGSAATLAEPVFANGAWVIPRSGPSATTECYTSPDGTAWTLRAFLTSRLWNRACYCGSGVWVVTHHSIDAAGRDLALSFDNGVTWNSSGPPTAGTSKAASPATVGAGRVVYAVGGFVVHASFASLAVADGFGAGTTGALGAWTEIAVSGMPDTAMAPAYNGTVWLIVPGASGKLVISGIL